MHSLTWAKFRAREPSHVGTLPATNVGPRVRGSVGPCGINPMLSGSMVEWLNHLHTCSMHVFRSARIRASVQASGARPFARTQGRGGALPRDLSAERTWASGRPLAQGVARRAPTRRGERVSAGQAALMPRSFESSPDSNLARRLTAKPLVGRPAFRSA